VVTAAGGSEDQLLLACGGLLLYLEVDVAGRQFVLKSQTKLDQDVACMSLWGSKEAVSSGAPSSSDTKVTGSAWFYKTASSKLVAVGMWTDNSVRMLELPSLREVAVVSLGTETQARDILLVSFDGVNSWLLVGLGDGTLLVYVIDTKNCTTSTVVKSRRKVTLGTRPISLSTFANEANLCVFATGDRPTVIHVQKGKLVLSSVNGGEVTRLTQLHMESHPESLAFASAKKNNY
jgi:DNA damage-binding protein 1